MHLPQISEARAELESRLEASIDSFVKKSGIALSDIKSITVKGWENAPTTACVEIEVKIDLPRAD